jgi:hypothetical protein
MLQRTYLLQAIATENPQLQYIVRDDAAKLMEVVRKNIDDKGFQKAIVQNMLNSGSSSTK